MAEPVQRVSGALRFAKICDPSFSRNALAIVTFLAGPVGAQELEGLTWSEQKCVLYDHAVESALGFQGLDGLREEFLSENRSFIDGGCQPTDHVCPITDAEIELANLLTIMTMNEGMASTFVPFSCR